MGDRQLRPLISRLMHTVGMDGGQLSDAQLVDRFVVARDEAAFESLMWRHGPMVLALCQRMLGHRHDAEDVFQAVFLVLFRKAHAISQRDHVASWLYKVAYRLAAKTRARKAKHPHDSSEVEALLAPDQPCQLHAADVRGILDDAVSRLPEKYRVALVLHYLEGKTVQKAAKEMGCPEGTVCGRLSRARELLRRRLARHGALLPSAILPIVIHESAKATPVTRALTHATLDATRAMAHRSSTAGTVSPAAWALADSATRVISVGRWKVVALVVLIAGIAGLSTGISKWVAVAPPAARRPLSVSSHHLVWTASQTSLPSVTPVEDPLPPEARARLGSQRFTYGAMMEALALSPDGTTVAGVGGTSAAVLWDAATGKTRTLLTSNELAVELCAVDFSPDGTDVAVGDTHGHAIVIPSWKTRAVHYEPAICVDDHHKGTVRAVRFAPDGRTVASAGDDGVVRLWIRSTGQVLHTLRAHGGAIRVLAFAPDGKTLASAGDDGEINLWDPATGALRRTCRGHKRQVHALTFSTDSQALASAGSDSHVLLWRAESKQPFDDYPLDSVAPRSLAFVDAKRLAVGGEGGVIRLFDISSHRPLRDYQGLAREIKSLTSSRDGHWLIAGGHDGIFQRWEVASGKADEHPPSGHRGPVFGVDVSPDGQVIASTGLDGTIRLWNLATGKPLEVYRPDWRNEPTLGHALRIAFVLDGRCLAIGGVDGVIHLWDRGRHLQTHWTAHHDKVTALASCLEGRCLVSAGADGEVFRWDAETGRKVCVYAGAARVVNSVAVSPDDKQLVGVDKDGIVHRWDLGSGKELGPLAGKGSGLALAAFSPASGLLVAGGPMAPLGAWQYEGGVYIPVANYEGDNRRAMALAFAPDGTLAVAGPDAIIRLWRNKGAEEVRNFAGHQNRINGLVFTPDGKNLVSASDDGTLLIWDVR